MVLAIVIVLVIGLLFIFGSYVFAEKLEASDRAEDMIEIPEELTKAQKAKVDKLISDYMEEQVNSKMGDIEAKLSEIVNQKTLALGDYAVTVNEEIQKNHQEVMFLYNMLNDKQKEIMTTANMVDDVKKEVKDFVDTNKATIQPQAEETPDAFDEDMKEAGEISDDILEFEDSDADVENFSDANKDVIMEMHKQGLSILEIAKHLGMGVGEVKLVVDLSRQDD